MELPADLRVALDSELRSIPARQLTAAVEQLSERYRAGHARTAEIFARSRLDILAYAAYRVPATFAALQATFEALAERLDDWAPASLLDVGAGPGTAMWAAAGVWPALGQITLLEREQEMIAFGRQLARHAHAPAISQAAWRSADALGQWTAPPHDLVVASYLLGELPQGAQAALLERLWGGAATALVLVEPGTPRGFELIRAARTQLLAAGAHLLAPCPHSGACPMAGGDWCHFAQRIGRTRLQRSVKQASLAYEDEKFSYIVASRRPGSPIAARVLRHPQTRPGQIGLELCTPAGLEQTTVGKRDRARFRQARDLRWGSAIPAEEADFSASEEAPLRND